MPRATVRFSVHSLSYSETLSYILNFVEISMLELLIGLVITIAVGYFIVKGYKAAGVLLTAGLPYFLLLALLATHTQFYQLR